MTGREAAPLRLLIDSPRWFIRPGNTDWRYVNSLVALEEALPLTAGLIRSWPDVVVESANYLSRRLRQQQLPRLEGLWKAGDADVVFSHRALPQRSVLPIVWMFQILDPEMQIARGRTPDDIERQYERLFASFKLAQVVQVSSAEAAARHAGRFGMPKEKFAVCPFFLPHLRASKPGDVARKHEQSDERYRILFVGHEAGRKGLGNLLASIDALPQALRRKIELTIVSRLSDFDRRSATTPRDVDLRLFASLPRHQVLAAFRAAHIYAMPSEFESYGLTYVEAAANGCAIIAPNWEAQREILDHGRAGVLIDPFRPITAVLADLLQDGPSRGALANAALQRFSTLFAAQPVADLHLRMFRQALSA